MSFSTIPIYPFVSKWNREFDSLCSIFIYIQLIIIKGVWQFNRFAVVGGMGVVGVWDGLIIFTELRSSSDNEIEKLFVCWPIWIVWPTLGEYISLVSDRTALQASVSDAEDSDEEWTTIYRKLASLRVIKRRRHSETYNFARINLSGDFLDCSPIVHAFHVHEQEPTSKLDLNVKNYVFWGGINWGFLSSTRSAGIIIWDI